jgi:predicted Zn-dependent peptidase
MISFSKKTLDNGLRVIIHRDSSTPLVTINILYQVGARNEREDRTGFAHLFEHLMFGGTRRYPDYDLEVDAMGGENNAFTNNDYTNYYLTVPAQHLERALRLEADRMLGDWDIVNDTWKVLDVQKRVVTEEYHQRYLNQPYGDVWMLLRPLCYKVHPYRWCTIGADIRHVQEATLQDVRDFFDRYYHPSNAILAIAGNVEEDKTLALVEQIFGKIRRPAPMAKAILPQEPMQTQARRMEVERDVPNNAIYKAWVMCDRWSPDYYTYDMVSDVLSNGHSSRMYRRLVQEEGLFSEIDAYLTGELDPGLFVVSGKMQDGVTSERAERAIDEEIAKLQVQPISEKELEKVANKFENTFVYSQYKTADRAHNLCYFEMIGAPELVNTEPECYRHVGTADLQRVAQRLTPERSSTLIINKKE